MTAFCTFCPLPNGVDCRFRTEGGGHPNLHWARVGLRSILYLGAQTFACKAPKHFPYRYWPNSPLRFSKGEQAGTGEERGNRTRCTARGQELRYNSKLLKYCA